MKKTNKLGIPEESGIRSNKKSASAGNIKIDLSSDSHSRKSEMLSGKTNV